MSKWGKFMLAVLMPLVSTLPLRAAHSAEIRAKFAVTMQEDSHQGQGVARFIELVQKKSNGRIAIKPYYNAVLGNDVQVTSALQGGSIEFTVPQTSTLTGLVPQFEALDLPFLFANEAEAEKVLDGSPGQKLLTLLPSKGLVGLAYWENGFFVFTNTKHPITRLEDFRGLKIRAVQSKLSMDTLSALGATPVALPVPEIYTALETKTVDGQSTPPAVIYALKFHEVQNYVSVTNHAYGAFIPLASKKFWDKLSEDDRRILMEAARETAVFQRGLAREKNRLAMQKMEEAGLKVNEISSEERQRMKAATGAIWTEYRKSTEVGRILEEIEATLVRKE
ncbi:MAG: DctP family TRAP transporter solute-binding subunit [Rhodocyclales bacterium]|nr:DctP family TRAP transporter solute-binding subunit [Rhodocyclales bacterium]